ncbi:putative zinc finger and BTB domain-containing protein 12-like isoform X2 [Penaeus vannamei]|uniref:Putative zinc finger and BTB domain-containing protein 12-like isoform X2 n=1 Tax=Penaeus vannamei TaxID=6689 RepID=A0A3R7QV22_PENVA|nr:putative zinc finger and BTB domain-containing protein 12-like isoform X2 [Penaeus vannamei]
MVGSDMQFCLRWNNFGTTMTAALHSLHEGGDFVDVTLAADGVQLKAHKLVLSACSPYFRDILKNNPCQHPVIILRDVPIEDLEAVLAFMYEGQVNVSQTRLHTFMKLAEALQVRGLTDTQTARARVEKVFIS